MNLSEYYHSVMELSHGIVVTLDRDGRIIHGNTMFEAVLGYPSNRIAGQNWFETVCVPENRTADEAAFDEVVAGGRLAFVKTSLRAMDGRTVHIDWNMKPLFDFSRQVTSVLCVGVDITPHIERQRELMQEHARLVAMNKELSCLHAMNRIVADTDSSLDEILQRILAIIPPSFQFPEHTGVRLKLDGRALFSGVYSPQAPALLQEDVVVHKIRRGRLCVSLTGETGGQAHAFCDTEQTLLSALAKHVSWIIAKREALATKRNLEKQLRHADRLAKIGQFAAGVAHELNEPLANILGFAQLAEQTPGLPEPAGRDLANIVKAALHGREIIKKLMIFGRQVPLQKTAVDLNQIVHDVLYFVEMSATRGRVNVQLELAEPLPLIMADPQHLKQVVVNLVVNAIHAMSDGGTLTIQTQCFEQDVYLSVSDTGQGMEADVLRQIFTPFYTTKDVDQGTGLGLAVVHGIITAHGGVIDVRSTPGQGSSFEITFPSGTTVQEDA